MAAKQPNDRLAALLVEARLSRKAFARSVQSQADAHGDPISVDHTAVGRWLDGVRARPKTAEYIAAALSARLGRTVTPLDAGMAPALTFPVELGLGYSITADTAVQATEQLLEGDLGQAATLRQAPTNSAAWAEASLSWLVRPDDDPLPTRREGQRVGRSDVEALRHTTALFSQLDDRFGGDHGRRAVAEFLRSNVGPLLRGTYNESTGRELFSASAEAMHLLAWMSYDSGAHGLAQRYFIQALRLAQAGDDVLLAGSTLDAMSHQATFLGRHREAATLARAARSGTRGQATATLTAHFFAMEARALAVAGDVKGTETALAQAATHFERRRPEDDPEWIQYFHEAEMSAEVAHCYRDLGLGARAAEAAGTAIAGSPRSDFFVTMVRAEGLLLAGDVQQSCKIGRQAIDVGATMKSARCIEYVRVFRVRLDATAGNSTYAVNLGESILHNALWQRSAAS